MKVVNVKEFKTSKRKQNHYRKTGYRSNPYWKGTAKTRRTKTIIAAISLIAVFAMICVSIPQPALISGTLFEIIFVTGTVSALVTIFATPMAILERRNDWGIAAEQASLACDGVLTISDKEIVFSCKYAVNRFGIVDERTLWEYHAPFKLIEKIGVREDQPILTITAGGTDIKKKPSRTGSWAITSRKEYLCGDLNKAIKEPRNIEIPLTFEDNDTVLDAVKEATGMTLQRMPGKTINDYDI